ncbi:MAG TPA: thiamine phosphate synthase [Deltaproteobacteria bacterium]|nr:thiamine phosphate synthase [Deltaproteobacteria bacterium]
MDIVTDVIADTRRGGVSGGLYALVDTSYVGPAEMERVAEELLEGGASVLQLRAKGLGAADMLARAWTLRRITALYNVPFIVNDRVDVALLCGADGVHLGQDDLPLVEARRLMGGGAVIGVSTHCVEEARRAASDGADYVAFGPIYPTRSKEDAHRPKGAAGLAAVAASVDIPVTAIGGITSESVAELIEKGASSVAIISDLLQAPDIRSRTERIVGIIESVQRGGGG